MKCLGLCFFIFTKIILESETPKSPAQLLYIIHIFYMDHTYQATGHRKKCCEYFGPQGVGHAMSLCIMHVSHGA